MLSPITDTEHTLDILLPSRPLEPAVPAPLIAAADNWSAAVWAEAVRLGPLDLTGRQLGQGMELARRPVYICGVHRSGTTLLRNILDGHPNLIVLPSEGTFYTVLESKLRALPPGKQISFLGREWVRRLANPTNQPPYWLLGRSAGPNSPYVNFARYFMAWWRVMDHKKIPQAPHIAVVLAYATCTGTLHAKHWVDKTPANERYLKRIWKEMPDARIIHMIRDPTTILNSRKVMEPSLNVRAVLNDMKMSLNTGVKQSQLNDTRYILVRYEDLCNEPLTMLENLASFLDIPVTASLNVPTVADLPVKANSVFANLSPAGKILKPQQHRQHDALTTAEHTQLAAYVSRPAEKLNYPTVQISSSQRFGILLKHALPRLLPYLRRQFPRYLHP